MIVIDYSQTIISALMAEIGSRNDIPINVDLLRHMVINNIRSHKVKFGREYGEIVIACDSKKYWRKQYFPNYSCSKQYSLNYRLDANPNSVNAEFFEKGNAENAKQYPNGFPWQKEYAEEYVVGPGITIVGG